MQELKDKVRKLHNSENINYGLVSLTSKILKGKKCP